MAEKSKTKNSNGEQSDICDLEQVTLKPQLEADHCFTTWLQTWHHSLQWGDSIRKNSRLRQAELLIRRPPRGIGDINVLLLLSNWRCTFTSEGKTIKSCNLLSSSIMRVSTAILIVIDSHQQCKDDVTCIRGLIRCLIIRRIILHFFVTPSFFNHS